MAVYRYATKDLSINNAQAFISALNASDGRNTKNSVILYAVIGNQYPYANEPTPINPEDDEQFLQYEAHREFIGGKKITTGDISHVAPRYNWTSGTVYSMYRDTDTDMYDRVYYILTDQFNVYKCLFNNKGVTSTVKPTGFSTSAFTTSDGYTWKYMYTISLGDANKFLTSVHMPVKTLSVTDGSTESDRQVAVKGAAVNGAIEVIETVSIGSGYHEVANGVVETGGRLALRLSAAGDTPPSPIDNFYNGSSVYIISGTGAGQLRRIVDYAGSTKTLTVNTAFATTPNTDSRVIVSPTLTIIGDGLGGKAYTRVNAGTGAIDAINMIDKGSKYTRASALVTANSIHGTGATANVVISPVGGHGSDPVRELAADKVMLNVQFKNTTSGISANGNGYIPSNTEFRTISILKDPVLKCDANNNLVQVEAIANTSNSPNTLRLTTRLQIAYTSNPPESPLQVRDIITNERTRLRAELGTLQFVTDLSPTTRATNSLANAVKGANANIAYIREDETVDDATFYTVYLNNVESYADNVAFTKDDVILKSTSEDDIATVEAIKGPEANTFSGQILYIENIQAVTRDPGQTEDIKIVLDF
tara:strand:+ start:7524 stop:9299 length:1776 start_codon:yes stop_codon:yes gene_type:complete